MSDEREHSFISGAPTASDAAPSSPGGWLKQERERQAITTQRIAADMHLSVAVIDAIESDRFASLGAPVFAKGHLRKYASLLNLPADRVAELYERLGAPTQVDPIPQTQRMPEPALRPGIREMLGVGTGGRPRSSASGIWIVVFAVAAIAIGAGAWWYLAQRNAPVAPAESGDVAPSQVVDASKIDAAKSDAVKLDGAKLDDARRDVAIAPAAVTAAQTLPSPAAATSSRSVRSGTPPPGKIRVRLTFARESWVEVYDGGGNRMLYDVGRTDLPRMIDVEPPALVVLGDAGAVTTEANDKAVSVPQKNITGTVARFTIAADGSVN